MPSCDILISSSLHAVPKALDHVLRQGESHRHDELVGGSTPLNMKDLAAALPLRVRSLLLRLLSQDPGRHLDSAPELHRGRGYLLIRLSL
eukprot:COSAG05_NODE_213_length_13909_cov_7.240550_7_plen_90_part_00